MPPMRAVWANRLGKRLSTTKNPADLAVRGIPPLCEQALNRSLLADRDVNVLGLGFLGLRKRDGQNAVLVGGRGFVHGHRSRERNGALEAAEEPLGAIHLGVLVLGFALALARNAQAVVVERNFNVFLLHARQLGLDDELVLLLVHVERGSPA